MNDFLRGRPQLCDRCLHVNSTRIDVANAPNGVNEVFVTWTVDFLPQQLHERVEGVVLNIASGSPHTLDQRLTRHSTPAPSHEVFQQAELGAREREIRPPTTDDMRHWVERQVCALKKHGLYGRLSPGQRMYPCEEHIDENGLVR